MTKFLLVFFVALGLQITLVAQENSPYSRYGIGDLTPNHNILTRGMGGIAAGYADRLSINFTNPASLGNLSLTSFDIGGDIDVRTLKSAIPVGKFTSTNTLISYVALGFPIASGKMKKKGVDMGLTFGLKPVSRVNYKIADFERSSIDSLVTTYEGEGGTNQFFIGTGVRVKNFSFGFTTGYMFGNKEYNTKREFLNDTVSYFPSNHYTQTRFGNIFLNAGVQYETIVNKNEVEREKKFAKTLRLGAYVNLGQKLNATQDRAVETFVRDGVGGTYRLDSVYENKDIKGKIVLPTTFGLGATYNTRHWLIGADFEMTNWSTYRFYGDKDAVQNSWVIRLGAQYFPANDNTMAKKYFSFVRYRAGLYFGPDYIKLSTKRNEFGLTAGAGFPLTSLRRISYSNDYVTLNTGIEYGIRGNIKTDNLKENIMRISIGISMNSQWFFKRKYD